MRKAIAVASVLAVAGWWACAARTGVEAPKPQQEARLTSGDSCQCASDPCPDDGGTNCLDISVSLNSSGKKKFSPGCDSHGWSLCAGQQVVISSELNEDLCVDLISTGGNLDGGTGSRVSLSSGASWTPSTLSAGEYCLSVCNKNGTDCSQGCKKSDCESDDATIRGNIDVVTKGPTEPEGER
ncbi:hypothetical protein MYSTI_08099 [Myxococcus stipitatus DSM 14675]|uniref:Lipoprotein n=1 Tax=Myxococcus stipitatus (strain DSM 14675 / JCM 12634 / Mx s8) TaxID=1278073 RepID=L7UN88_MYXSD|nr:hypothetical protein MYSTI_08099 [Myxococcus stipitatus DSM 14675]